jgi:hypothetical protein
MVDDVSGANKHPFSRKKHLNIYMIVSILSGKRSTMISLQRYALEEFFYLYKGIDYFGKIDQLKKSITSKKKYICSFFILQQRMQM